jgi:hypothetical protein
MGRSVLSRVHNPRGRACACLPTCWCKRTTYGYLVRWYIPGRFHRLPNPFGFADVPESH